MTIKVLSKFYSIGGLDMRESNSKGVETGQTT